MTRRKESGAVLLTVLLMVAVMAAVAVAMMEEIRLSVKRTANAEISAQAQWYALGAETFAAKLVARAEKLGAGEQVRARLGQPMVLPVDGGRMVATIRDATNCFNLNSLAQPAGADESQGRARAQEQFRNLLRALGLFDGDQDRLAGALTDWVDEDSRPESPGAEDQHYTRLDPPFRTANALLTGVGELRAVAGFELETYRLLRPFVCARPDMEQTVLNLNSLTPEDAPLLIMLAGKELSLDAARQAIAARPGGGFADAEAFWAQTVLAGRNPGEAAMRQTGVEARYYELQVTVVLDGREAGLTSLLAVGRGRQPAVVARRFGVPE